MLTTDNIKLPDQYDGKGVSVRCEELKVEKTLLFSNRT